MKSANTTLPDFVDNSELPYFRSIFQGLPMACAHSAEIGYTFTYEVNRMRDMAFDENDSTSLFSISFTYNMNANGGHNPTFPLSGFETAEVMGCADVATFGSFQEDPRRWMTGYDKYEQALANKVESINTINVATPQGLNNLKHWINDHGKGDSTGGLAVFVTYMNNYDSLVELPPESFDAGKTLIKDMIYQTDSAGNPEGHGHEMTFVGYNDLIKYDFNGDGVFTNDIDINNDDTVDMREWEIGALKLAGSSGVNWLQRPNSTLASDSGFLYLPYRLLAKPDINHPNSSFVTSHPYPIDNQKVYVIDVITDYDPKLLLEAEFEHNNRELLSFYMGDEPPDSKWEGNWVLANGGVLSMQGINQEPIEMLFDFSSEQYWDKQYGDGIAIKVYEWPMDTCIYFEGNVLYYGMIDNDGVRVEIEGEQSNVYIDTLEATQNLLIDYFYIPSVIDETIDFSDTDTIPINKDVKVTDFDTILLSNNTVVLKDDVALTINENSYCNITNDVFFQSEYTSTNFVTNGNLVIENNAQLACGPNIGLHGTTQTGKVIVNGCLKLSDQSLSNIAIMVQGGGTLIIEDAVTFESSASLTLEEGATIEGTSSGNILVINGPFSCGPNTTIKNFTHDGTGYVEIYNGQAVTFDNVIFINTHTHIKSRNAPAEIRNSSFTGSSLYLEGEKQENCVVDNNVFNFSPNTSALRVESYLSYAITNNVVENNSGNGIALYYTGNEAMKKHDVTGNTIRYNYGTGNSKGLLIYSSVTRVNHNRIYENDYGAGIFHKSTVEMYGDSKTGSQQIYNNRKNQIIATDNSFPWYFRWNIVQKTSSSYPLIYCQEVKTFVHDVSNNCWGDNFVPQEDLVPLKSFTFFPPWDCEFGEALDDPSAPMIAYETAINEVEDADYTGAEAQLQSIVSTWPESSFASTAMKMMPAIAVQLNNLNQLINYYNTNSNIQQDEELKKLAGYLTADCRVYMENYQAALSFYEDIIADPPTPEDSIYAVIDAGKVSYMMEENGKAASASFKFQEMIPKTFELYTRNRKKLLDEIGGMPNDAEEIVQQPNETNSDLPTGEVDIYPNPVQNTLNITCNFHQAGTVAVKIYNSAGKLIRALHHEMSNSVQYQETVNMEDLPDGIYFIKIDQNLTTLHTQSIVVN
ncbi:hypothetical protein L21SP5_02315 [Salinivirga cyanobacteriivorans]|uniref:Secretion system C-terminal sorting domain-containing protein n=1 Tax=Salinivirga cyanobacteriivorans TaxID=1307839 RepID=A0A0S2I116_9BACT|nr:T9SS type A sorting domain-containing protein [Salinivirga cyanobacteriivorans]ALO15947.1 hypothetical protein L21SP5_02315 [Salinivirga cyanobacteriivorans]